MRDVRAKGRRRRGLDRARPGIHRGWWRARSGDCSSSDHSQHDGDRRCPEPGPPTTGWATDRLRALLPRPYCTRNRDDIGAHYDIGNAIFELFLDETMTYSSAVFPAPTPASQTRAVTSTTCCSIRSGSRKVTTARDRDRVGRPSPARSETLVGHTTTTTISAEQLVEARRRVDAAGHQTGSTLLDVDWRELSGRSISHLVEMIEAVDWRDYEAFSQRSNVPEARRADAIQAICLPEDATTVPRTPRTSSVDSCSPTDACRPSAQSEAVGRATAAQVIDVEDFPPHCVETLRRWRPRSRTGSTSPGLGLDERFVSCGVLPAVLRAGSGNAIAR